MSKNNTLEELKAKFDALCDEQEQLPRTGFAKVFEALDSLEETFTTQHPYTENEDNINKALELTGHSNDEAFCKAFKRNNQIIIDGKEIQRKMLSQMIAHPPPSLLELKKRKREKLKNELSSNEWLFYPISIYAPKEVMPIIDARMEKDAKEGKRLYGNVTDIPEEDESLDDWFEIDAYGLKCSLEPLYRDLQSYGVLDSILENETIRKFFLQTLKETLIGFIKENTNKPNKVRNHISATLKKLDDIPSYGLLLQILLLQGLIKWFEDVSLKDGDTGYNEACTLVQWIGKQLMKKEVRFCFFRWGDSDKKWLKPFCNYLHSHEIGKEIQVRCREYIRNGLFIEENKPQQEISETPRLPKILNTDESKDLFAKAISNGLMTDGYVWLKGLQLLSCFAREISLKLKLGKGQNADGTDRISWKPFEELFDIEKGKLRSNYNDIQKTGIEPTDIHLVNSVFD